MKVDLSLSPNRNIAAIDEVAAPRSLAQRAQAITAPHSLSSQAQEENAVDAEKQKEADVGPPILQWVENLNGGQVEPDNEDDDYKVPTGPMWVKIDYPLATPEPPKSGNYGIAHTDHQAHAGVDRSQSSSQDLRASVATAQRSRAAGESHATATPVAATEQRKSAQTRQMSTHETAARTIGRTVRARIPVTGKLDAVRARKMPPAEIQTEFVATNDLPLPAPTPFLETLRTQRERQDAGATTSSHKQQDDDAEQRPAVVLRTPQPMLASAAAPPPEEDQAHTQAQPRSTLRQYVSKMQQAPVEAPSPEGIERSDTYEVTYRFTSWSNDASVKLQLKTSDAGRPVVATPSDARVHSALRANLSKVSATAPGRLDPMPIQLDAPAVTLVDSDEQGQQHPRGKPRTLLEQEAQ